MALKASVPILLTCTTIFLPTSTSASLNGQLAERQLAGRHPLTRSIDARDRSNTLPLTTQDPSNLPNDASDKPPTSNMTSCQTYGCNLFYQVIHISLSRLLSPANRSSMPTFGTSAPVGRTQPARVWALHPRSLIICLSFPCTCLAHHNI